MRAATSGVEAVDEAVDQAIDASMRGCLPTAKQSGVARVTTYFHVLTLSLEFPFSTHELTNHDPAQEYDNRVHTRYITTKTTTQKPTPPP
jgi:hypothetical protein